MTPTQNISISELEKVPIADIMDMMSAIMRGGKESASDMIINLNQVPFICKHIESMERNIASIVDSITKIDHKIESNWDQSQRQHESFITKESMASFKEVYIIEQQGMKRAIYGCTAAIMLAILANFISRFIAF